MTTPDKDKVVDDSAEDNAGMGETPSTPDANGAGAAGSADPAGQAAEADAEADAAAADPADPAAAEAVEAEVIDPELAAEADAAVEGVDAESEIVAQAKAEVAEWKDKYVRLHAEWDTYRRRTNEQREAEKARATEKLVTSLLPVLDDFERTIAYANDNGEVGLLGGVEAVHAKLVDTLVKGGVEIIDPAGEAFDALEAQAVATVPDETVPDETVAQVYQKGYRMGAKVLRPAMVTVTTGGPKRERPSEEE
ncbi:nucleotide exchange factor GrpE [Adlercreutzia sp. ZJ242]|uniref:nucleotide exchange factor GrpE n=1 Tax=Adlercreutzia sp. ZJ242 TaxID=2709409 RepID=UPI001F14E4F0|nr:nucleotide exchange factor GrpE [Adlercreutzia sp. ZJ242]